MVGLEWPGATVAILASGPSMSTHQARRVMQWATADRAARKVIAVNCTFRLAKAADVLYACDGAWWQFHIDEVADFGFEGSLWTQDERAAGRYRLNYIRSENKPGLGMKPGVIHQGGNGGFQSVNLAAQAGATRILLFGFDMNGGHWHGAHKNQLPNPTPPLILRWIKKFELAAPDLIAAGVEVVNCTPRSHLTCFPTMDMEDALS